jgi:hypothetical protein
MLGMLSPYEYTWTTVGKGAVMFFTAVVAFMTAVAGVKLAYPDRISYPREYADGLERELGGPGAIRVSISYVSMFASEWRRLSVANLDINDRRGRLATQIHRFV